MKNQEGRNYFLDRAFETICSGRCEEVFSELLQDEENPEARELLLRIASDRDHLSRLSNRQINSARTHSRRTQSEIGNYLYCRWLQEIKGDYPAHSEAAELLRTIADRLPDAKAALAELKRITVGVQAAWEQYQYYLDSALAEGSQLALYYRKRDWISGTDDSGELDHVIKVLKKAIKDQKAWPYGIHFHLLGKAYEKSGMPEEALKAYKRSSTLGHLSAKEDIRRLEGYAPILY